jgi:hypothetical protein
MLAKQLLAGVDALDDVTRQQVIARAERISAMADEAGQTAIFGVVSAECQDQLDELENGRARAMWMWLNDLCGFGQAEEVRFSDSKRFGRMWEAFTCEKGLQIAQDVDTIDGFEQAIRSIFRSTNAKVETCDRIRTAFDEEDARLIQVAIYREGRPEDRRAFLGGELEHLVDRPVLEAALTYEQATGVIEVVANDLESRIIFVRLFAEHVLHAPFTGEKLRLCQYDLDPLRRPFSFPTEAQDNIESVRVVSLRLMPLDTQSERIILGSMGRSGRSIWDMAAGRFGEYNPLTEGYRVTQARLVVRFNATPGVRGGRTLPVTISLPHACDLKDRTQREQIVGRKYLPRWGLVREV